MGLIDAILNIAALLLWLNWRTSGPISFTPHPGQSLLSTLRPADRKRERRWTSLAVLGGLLLGRALIYWHLGGAMQWAGVLDFGVTSLSFRSDAAGRMLLFSLLGFVHTLGVFYICLLLLSVVRKPIPEQDSYTKLVQWHLGPLARLPKFILVLLPLVLAGLAFAGLHPLLSKIGIIPTSRSAGHLWQQVAVVSLCGYLPWKYLIAGILFIHLINSYVYLGAYPFLNYVTHTAQRFLRWIAWIPLRAGRVDFAPVVLLALLFLFFGLAERGLGRLFQRLLV